MKKIKITLIAATFCAASYCGYTAYQTATMTDAEKFILANIEALTNDSEPWKDKKLKTVECTCPTTGKSGKTLKCYTDGDLEECTITQQGSDACYKISFSGMDLC